MADERTSNIGQEEQERIKSIRLQFKGHVPLQRPVEDTRSRLGQFIDKVKDVVRERRNAREDAQIVGNTKQMISEGAAMLKDRFEAREERSSFVVEPRQMELTLASRGELSQAQMQDLARQTLAWEKMSSNTEGHNPQREHAQAQTAGMRV